MINSIENVLKNAVKAGFQVEKKTKVNDGAYDIYINLKKKE